MTAKKTVTEKSVWETLNAIDVSQHIQEKGGFKYLSWAWAWQTLKAHYPDATFTKHKSEQTELPYFTDTTTGNAFVAVTVRVKDVEATEYYPVLDHKNQPIVQPNAFQVNNALQRGMTKAMAYLGLGAYIYAGEDLPFIPPESRVALVEGESIQGVEFIKAALEAWLPMKHNLDDLRQFWESNAEPIRIVKEGSPKHYEELLTKFKQRKREITDEGQE